MIERAGVTVRWADNQSGCKGTCTPGMIEPVAGAADLCPEGRCYDMALVGNIRKALARSHDTARQLVVLHMIGSHGPAYYKRVPEGMQPFGAGCRSQDLGACSPGQVRDAYDNSIAYTDRVVASAIDTLAAVPGIDAVLLYDSDHGESLGEKGLWLHGAPWWAGIEEQTQVPMVMWMNDGARERFGVDPADLQRVAGQQLSHDNLADTLLGLCEVRTSVYRSGRDLLARARSLRTSSGLAAGGRMTAKSPDGVSGG